MQKATITGDTYRHNRDQLTTIVRLSCRGGGWSSSAVIVIVATLSGLAVAAGACLLFFGLGLRHNLAEGGLPEGWTEHEHDGKTYYVHEKTGETTWEHPASGGSSSSLPKGWTKELDEESGKTYYVSPTGETSWDPPNEGHKRDESEVILSGGGSFRVAQEIMW